MKKQSINIAVFLLLIFVSGVECQSASDIYSAKGRPKNIILFIGDGMGVSHLYAGMTESRQSFNLEKFPFSGFSKTYSADNYITDSGAGATAIACGIKTNNGMIGVGPDGKQVRSIMEIAHQAGLATGVISTSAVTHATPASFVAHNSERANYEEIAKDFLNGTLDLFLGGGEDHFRSRKDSVDLAKDLISQGYEVVYSLEELQSSKSGRIAGLLSKDHMATVLNGRQGALRDMTSKAIEVLSRNKVGFVLMIEGSMIDWGAHANNLDYVVSEVVDLDEAVGAALEYASGNRNTLIVVTADHETGGLSLNGGSLNDHKVSGDFSTKDHTAEMVPIFSFGPGASRFSGIHENTFFLGEFLDLLKLK